VPRVAAADRPDPGLPIKLHPVSNGEYNPPPVTPVLRETAKLARRMCEENARRAGMDRRSFLLSSMGAATTLWALAACSSGDDGGGSGSGGGKKGGTYNIPDEAMVDKDAALDALGSDMPVVDMQTHLLEYPADYNGFHLGQIFQNAKDCGDESLDDCFSTERWLEEVFERSDTTVGVLSALPVVNPDRIDPLSAQVMDGAREEIDGVCGDGRILVQGHAWVNIGELDGALAAMDEEGANFPITAWKTYTHIGDGGYFLDDHDPAGLQVGEAFLNKVEDIGPNIVCVHKGFAAQTGGDKKFADPVDIGPAAKAHPDIRFCVYHSGFEVGAAEGAYDPANPGQGVDRLIKSVQDAGIGPGENVYAELGSTWFVVMRNPEMAAHVLGKLLVAFGPERILWGTDSIWYGSPQDQIQALRAFEITPEFQDQFGYPELTDEIKHRIFWRNAAELMDVDVWRKPCEVDSAATEEARQSSRIGNRTYGPTTALDARKAMRDGHPWVFWRK
jgi:uncharacterized protein